MAPLHSYPTSFSVAFIGSEVYAFDNHLPHGPFPLNQVPMMLLREALLLSEYLNHHQGLGCCQDIKGLIVI